VPPLVYRERAWIRSRTCWFETAFAYRDLGVTFSASDPCLRPLHGNPRWRPFLERLNLT
jgi:hypothetical protein